MKKYILYIALISGVVLGCKSPSKLIEQGDYNKAIEKSIKKMLKGNANNEDKLMLDKAYNLANQQDFEHIRLLKAEGKPFEYEIFNDVPGGHSFDRMDGRFGPSQ